MTSIKAYLISWILGLVVTSSVVIIYISYTETKHEIEELFSGELVKTAKIFSSFINIKESIDTTQSTKILYESQISYLSDNLADKSNLPNKNRQSQQTKPNTQATPLHEYEGKISFGIYNSQYKLLLDSPNSPQFEPSTLKQGFMVETIKGEKWHLFVLKQAQSDRS